MKYILGVDGGNTKTDYLLYDVEGNFIDGLRSGTCSHEGLKDGFEGAYRVMNERITELLSRNGLTVEDVAASAMGLAGIDCQYQKEQIETLIMKLVNLGIDNVVLTSVCLEEGTLGTATYTKDGEIEYYFNNEISGYFHGTGDVFGSALVGAYVCGATLSDSAKIAADYVIDAICETVNKDDFDPKYGVNFELVTLNLINNVKKLVNSK